MLALGLGMACGASSLQGNEDGKNDDDRLFTQPKQLMAEGEAIKVESPGYACPSLHDLDADGIKDLLVGQYAGGKIKVYPGLGDGKYAAGEWLEAEGSVAEVPGVW